MTVYIQVQINRQCHLLNNHVMGFMAKSIRRESVMRVKRLTLTLAILARPILHPPVGSTGNTPLVPASRFMRPHYPFITVSNNE